MRLTILPGDCRETLKTLPDDSVHCCITSPPYFGLRDYGCQGQMGLEATPEEFVAGMAGVFREVRRVLRHDGTLWLNMGDSYSGSGKGGNPLDSPHQKQRTNAGSVTVIGNTAREAARTKLAGDDRTFGLKPKDLIGIPWMLAFALRADGWYLRQDIIWSKPNPMPESVTDRCTKAHEYVFMLSKSARYFYDQDSIKEPMSLSSVSRLAQDVEGQIGSARVPGKTNGRMKAVGGEKQRGHGRRHAGFNDRWDAMEREDQCSGMRNKRSVWEVATQPFRDAHFATFPPALIRPCVRAGCPVGGIILDPFGGSGTTGMVAIEEGRSAILCELNPAYIEIASRRCDVTPGFQFAA